MESTMIKRDMRHVLDIKTIHEDPMGERIPLAAGGFTSQKGQ